MRKEERISEKSGAVGMGMRINRRGLENGRGRDGEPGRRWCLEGKEGKTRLHKIFHLYYILFSWRGRDGEQNFLNEKP